METSLSRTNLLREIRKMRFEEAYEGWRDRRLTQEEAGRLLGMSERNFRRYEADGLEGASTQFRWSHAIERFRSAARRLRRVRCNELLAVQNGYQQRKKCYRADRSPPGRCPRSAEPKCKR